MPRPSRLRSPRSSPGPPRRHRGVAEPQPVQHQRAALDDVDLDDDLAALAALVDRERVASEKNPSARILNRASRSRLSLACRTSPMPHRQRAPDDLGLRRGVAGDQDLPRSGSPGPNSLSSCSASCRRPTGLGCELGCGARTRRSSTRRLGGGLGDRAVRIAIVGRQRMAEGSGARRTSATDRQHQPCPACRGERSASLVRRCYVDVVRWATLVLLTLLGCNDLREFRGAWRGPPGRRRAGAAPERRARDGSAARDRRRSTCTWPGRAADARRALMPETAFASLPGAEADALAGDHVRRRAAAGLPRRSWRCPTPAATRSW